VAIYLNRRLRGDSLKHAYPVVAHTSLFR
jgi:hypothetical protein